MKTKCVIWDLDNTLWQGTLMEGDDLVLTPGVKAVICELDARGILQSIASKNDYTPAWEKLEAFGLDEYFLHPQIGWGTKSDSIKAIADKLRIGLDTLVFVDDQSFERDEVRYFIPQVKTVDAADIDQLLDLSEMQPGFVTQESKARRKLYHADIQRKKFESDFLGSKEEFLKTLGMCLTIRACGELDLMRAEELIVRTNQLNTTGLTYSYQELSKLAKSPDHALLVAELEDRYGTYGIIGLALIEKGFNTWLLKLLITSCRVMTRGVGGFMISNILISAKQRSAKMTAHFVATDRNRLMYVTFKFHGFYEVSEKHGLVLLAHDLDCILPLPHYLTVRSYIEE